MLGNFGSIVERFEADSRWIFGSEAARRLGVGIEEIRRLIEDHQLGAVIVGRVLFVWSDSIDSLIAAGMVERGCSDAGG